MKIPSTLIQKLNIPCMLLLALTLLFSGCGQGGSNSNYERIGGKPGGSFGKPERPKFKIPVTAMRVKRERMYAYLEQTGTVIPIKDFELKPEMTERIYFTKRWMEGDEVKKGEVFASMDDRQLKLDIQESQLQLDIAIAAVKPASANLTQSIKDEEFKKEMFERGAISKAEYEQATLSRIQRQNAYEQSLSSIQTRRMALEKTKRESEKVQIIFPFDGILLPSKETVSTQTDDTKMDLTILHSQMVGQNQVLCRLANIDQVFVALDLPAKDLLSIKVGQDVELEIYSRVGHSYRGTVAEISTALNSGTRTYTVNVLVDNPNHELRPGMFAKGRIITQERPDAICVSRELVLLRNNKKVVYVVKEKPEDEVESATSPIKINRPDESEEDSQKSEVAQSGGFEKVAMAADNVNNASDEDEFGEEYLEDETPVEEEPDMIAEECEILTGIENREQVEIVDGLIEGDLLVILGYETLTDGVDVNVSIREEDPLAAAVSLSPSQ